MSERQNVVVAIVGIVVVVVVVDVFAVCWTVWQLDCLAACPFGLLHVIWTMLGAIKLQRPNGNWAQSI